MSDIFQITLPDEKPHQRPEVMVTLITPIKHSSPDRVPPSCVLSPDYSGKPWGHRKLGEPNKIITCELSNKMVFWRSQILIYLTDIKQLKFFFKSSKGNSILFQVDSLKLKVLWDTRQ